MKGRTPKRCGCRHPDTRRQLGQSRPELRRAGGGCSRNHGDWYLQIELPARRGGARRPLRDGAYPSQTGAEAVLDRIRAALAVPDPGDAASLRRVGDIVETAGKNGEPVPTAQEIRRALHLDVSPRELPTLAQDLTPWLPQRKTLKARTPRPHHG